MRYPGWRHALLPDDGRKGSDLQALIPERMRFESLPPWSPQLNPAEHLWEEVREKWLATYPFSNLEAVERQLMRGLIS